MSTNDSPEKRFPIEHVRQEAYRFYENWLSRSYIELVQKEIKATTSEHSNSEALSNLNSLIYSEDQKILKAIFDSCSKSSHVSATTTAIIINGKIVDQRGGFVPTDENGQPIVFPFHFKEVKKESQLFKIPQHQLEYLNLVMEEYESYWMAENSIRESVDADFSELLGIEIKKLKQA